MRINSKLILLLACAALILATPVWADVPQNMNVQGRLTDAAGDPLPAGFKIFTFKIWDAEVGGAEVWPGGLGEDQTLFTDDGGLWTARVGELLGLSEVVFQDTTRWLEVTVNDGMNPVETLSRIKLNTNPFTYRSASSQQADVANNADLLDGLNSTDFAADVHSHTPVDITPQGSGSTLDADLLDGNDATAFADSAHVHNEYVNQSGDVMTDDLRWLGIGGALSLRADASANTWTTFSLAGTERTSTLGGQGSGELKLYSSSAVRAFLSGVGNSGSLGLYVFPFTLTARLDAGLTSGATLNLYQQDATPGMFLRGGSTSDGSTLQMYSAGGSNTIYMDADLTGNGAVRLPTGSISSDEISNEPGIAQGISKATNIFITSTTVYTDVVTVTISTPASGYIVVEAISWTYFFGTTGSNYMLYQIDETAGGSDNIQYYAAVGSAAGHVSTSNDFSTAVSRRTYQKAAGIYTFRLEARKSGAGTGVFHNPSITAIYYPRSYGAVSIVAPASEAGEFDNATPVPMGENPLGENISQSEQMYVVDLRELELKATRAEAVAEKAKRELLEAQLQIDRPGMLNPEIGDQKGDQ